MHCLKVINPMKTCIPAALLLLLYGCSGAEPPLPAGTDAPAVGDTPQDAPSSDPAGRRAWFGDLHLHTAMSFDAASAGTITTPDQAYRFARGEAVEYFGQSIQRTVPLDFLAVTDHAEYLAVAVQAADPQGPFAGTGWPARLAEAGDSMIEFLRIFSPGGFRGEAPIAEFVEPALIRSNWQRQVEAAERHYAPGEFTTFVAYEWSPMPGGAHLHRNVIFRGPGYPDRPFTAIDSLRPEDLWSYAENQIAEGRQLVLIPHNSNLSEGLMFAPRDSDGGELSADYARRRASLERLVEITQIKGTSETRPELSPTDEHAGFELVNFNTSADADLRGAYVRPALMRGLELEAALGSNPFRFGLIGSSDFHSGLSSSEEFNYPGGLGDGDEQSDPERVLRSANPLTGSPTTVMSASGLAGIWAEENTRESLFAAMQRREVFATSGNRMQLRMFAGRSFDAALLMRDDWVATAYARGTAMGEELAAGDAAPVFILQAVKDPEAGNLDRIQVVKLWLEDGRAREKIFDAVWDDGRSPDAAGKLPALPSTVDLDTASYTNTEGSPALLGLWTDPEFDPDQPAIYYARALEIETPRWSTYLAVRNGLPLSTDVPATIQERAWSSPVFYSGAP